MGTIGAIAGAIGAVCALAALIFKWVTGRQTKAKRVIEIKEAAEKRKNELREAMARGDMDKANDLVRDLLNDLDALSGLRKAQGDLSGRKNP